MMRYQPQPSRRRNNPARLRLESLESRQLLATLTVNSTADASPPADVLTLREAIELVDGMIALSNLSSQAQAQVTGSLSGPNTIAFDIPGQGVQTITPSSPLPAITAPVTINGYTQPGASPNTLAVGDNAVLLIELDGQNAGDAASSPVGLMLEGGDSTVEGLVVNRFNGCGIETNDSGGDCFDGNFIGSDPAGTIDPGDQYFGLMIDSGNNDVIGGIVPSDRNVISGNENNNLGEYGSSESATDTIIQGNYIGTNASGTKALSANPQYAGSGVDLRSVRGALIGGAVAGAGNVISGNDGDALDVVGNDYPGDDANVIQGNFIGTDASGTKPVPNAGTGILLSSSENTVGGTTSGARNIIASNSYSGMIVAGSKNLIEGNFVGTGVSGTEWMSNGTGIAVTEGIGNTIGGTAAGAGNIIANSLHQGIALDYEPVNTLVLSNSITKNAGGGIAGSAKPSGNPPVLAVAELGPDSTSITGSLDNIANSTFTIQFFANTELDLAGQAEGQRYLGSSLVKTGVNGQASISVTLPVTIAPGEWVTATASTPGQNTTPFSTGVQAVNVPSQVASATTLAIAPVVSAGERIYAFTLTATVGSRSQTLVYQPEGSVTFRNGATVLGTVPLNGYSASLTTGILPAGTNSFTATFSGGGGYAVSLSSSVSAVSQDVPPTLVTAQRGSIRGSSIVTLTFTEPMSFLSVRKVDNYQVVPVRTLRNGRTVLGQPIRVRSAQMSASTESVTLVLAQRLAPRVSYQITVRGTPPGGAANAGGTLLNGDGSGAAGSNAVVVLPPLAQPSDPHARPR